MKNIFFVATLLFFACGAHAQHNPESVSFKKIAKERSAELHKNYPKVAAVKFEGAASIHEQHEQVDKAWHDLWDKFTHYYQDKGLTFSKMRKVYVHLHLSEKGHLDYFGYHFKGKEDEQAKKFVALFHEFVKDHELGLNKGVKFSQCGELHLQPKGIKEGM